MRGCGLRWWGGDGGMLRSGGGVKGRGDETDSGFALLQKASSGNSPNHPPPTQTQMGRWREVMGDPLLGLGNLVPKETVTKLYDDVMAGPAKEVGKLGTDTMKVARLILAPLQIGSAFQDRFERMIERIRTNVPQARMTEAPPELTGPILEKMRYVSEDSELWKMFEEVLTKSIDQDQLHKVHPSFGYIIAQLSRDEAWMLLKLRDRTFEIVDTLDFNRPTNRFSNRVIEKSSLPTSELHAASRAELNYSHLVSLSLVSWIVDRQEPIEIAGFQTGLRRFSTIRLTDFGRLFVEISIPPNGFQVDVLI